MKQLITFFEIPAKDFSRAVEFYNELLDLQLVVCGEPCVGGEEEQMAFFPDGANVKGAVSRSANFNPSSDGVLITFSAEGRLDEMLEKVVALGGTILRGKTPIEAEGQGSFALIADTEGNRIGLHSVTE